MGARGGYRRGRRHHLTSGKGQNDALPAQPGLLSPPCSPRPVSNISVQKNISSFAFDFLDPLNSGVAVTSSLVQDRQTDELLPGKCEVARQIDENKVTKPKTIETTT
jgi:hypothetical protein